MTMNEHFPPPLTVAVLLPHGGQLLAAVGLLEAFDAANRVRAARSLPPLYSTRLVGVSDATRTAIGPEVHTEVASEVPSAHTVVVAGMLDLADTPVDPALLNQARRLTAGADRVVGVCMGTFVLGELGLLDGRRCTTHWLALDALNRRFPTALVESDAIYTEDEPLFTSAGGTAGIDLALQLIRRDGGHRLALAVARVLVVFAHRPGGQSQFGSAVRLPGGLDRRLEDLVAHLNDNPSADHRVDLLAARVGMSPRHFARVFRQQTGHTPAALVAKIRVETAQRALLSSDASIAAVAEASGFGTETTLRRTFQRVVGVSPSAYRARFA